MRTQFTLHFRTLMLVFSLAMLAMLVFAGPAAACNSTGGGDFPC